MTNPQLAEVSDPMIGRVLLGRYRVMAPLAKGGMGVVYLARMEGSAGFQKPVVIKLILPDHSDNPEFVGMFEREAQILAHLRDPGIVDVLDFSRERDAYVMALEYVRGYHLGQWLKYLRIQQSAMPTGLAMLLVIDVLESLHHAHTARHHDGSGMNIVHRDVSPSNVLLDSSGRARLLDFGVARMKGEQVYKTQVKGFRGKLSYSAPELFSGSDASVQSDLYSCGVVLHEILSGRNTFRGASQNETFHNVLTKRPAPIHAVRDDAPDAIDDLLARALAKEPARRYPSAAAFASALRSNLLAPEHEIREELSRFVAEEVLEDMARVLGVESLAERDRAWQDQDMPREWPEGSTSGTRTPIRSTRRGSQAPAASSQRATEASTVSEGRGGIASTPRSQRWLWGALLACTVAIGVLAGVLASKGAPTEVRVVELPDGAPLVAGTDNTAAAGSPASDVLQGVLPSGGLAAQTLEADSSGAVAVEPVEVESQAGEPGGQAGEPGGVESTGQASDEPSGSTARSRRASANERAAAARRARASSRTQGPDAAALTRAFRQRQPQIERCFVEHARSLEGTPQLEVGFAVDAQGRLLQAELRPRQVKDTALGRCIVEVSKGTRFPAQGQPLEFRIPVSARRVR